MFNAAVGPDEMQLLSAAASGMSAQRTALDLAARNVAAAQASTPEHPYVRLVAQFGSTPIPPADGGFDPVGELQDEDAGAETVVGLRREAGSGDALTEMIAVLDAQRAYEQNASIFDTAKRLAERTIDIGRV